MSLPLEGGREVSGSVGTRSPATGSKMCEAHVPWLRSTTCQLTRRRVEESSSFFWPLTSSIGAAIPFSGQGDLVLGLWDYVLGTRRRSSSFPLNDQICQLHPPSLLSTSPLQPKFLSSISDQLPSPENLDADRGIATIHRRLQNHIAFRRGVRNTKESLPSLLLLHWSKSRNLHCFDADPVELLFLETRADLSFSYTPLRPPWPPGRQSIFPHNFLGEKKKESRVL